MANELVEFEDNDAYMDVDVIIEKEDRMDINEPIIKQKKRKHLHLINNQVLPNRVDYLTIERFRNVSICGNLHSGKTCLIDYLLSTSHAQVNKFTDHHILEFDRKISIKSTPISIQVGNTKTMQFNLIDYPGHSGCIYEYQNLQMTDGCCVVVDVVEGLLMSTKTSIEYCIKLNIPFVVVLNKMDRLIIELKLPPNDAYQKIQVVLNDINRYIKQIGGTIAHRIHPLKNNVIFSSFAHGWCFSLKSFAESYLVKSKYKLTVDQLKSRLWGDFAYKNGSFVHSQEQSSFSDFILEPIYKVYGIILGDPMDHVKAFIANMNIKLPHSTYKESPTIIAKVVMQHWMGNPQPLIDLLSELPPPNPTLLLNMMPNTKHALYKSIALSSPTDTTIVHISSMYYYDNLLAFGRVVSGTLMPGQKLRINVNNESFVEIINDLYLPFARTLVPINKASIGEFVLLRVSEHVRPNILMVSVDYSDPILNPTPLYIKDPKWLYIAIEPRLPSNLPKLLNNVIIITRIYSGIEFRKQDSGEYGLYGANEFVMDCVLHDLRFICEFDVRVSDPIAKLRETVLESSQIQCQSISPNLK